MLMGTGILGVEQPAGTRLNPTDKTISKTISGTTVFDLYASNSGYFVNGQNYKVVVKYSDGTSNEYRTTVISDRSPTTTSPLATINSKDQYSFPIKIRRTISLIVFVGVPGFHRLRRSSRGL